MALTALLLGGGGLLSLLAVAAAASGGAEAAANAAQSLIPTTATGQPGMTLDVHHRLFRTPGERAAARDQREANRDLRRAENEAERDAKRGQREQNRMERREDRQERKAARSAYDALLQQQQAERQAAQQQPGVRAFRPLAILKRKDKDGDGIPDPRFPNLPQLFKRKDKDGDGQPDPRTFRPLGFLKKKDGTVSGTFIGADGDVYELPSLTKQEAERHREAIKAAREQHQINKHAIRAADKTSRDLAAQDLEMMRAAHKQQRQRATQIYGQATGRPVFLPGGKVVILPFKQKAPQLQGIPMASMLRRAS